ncbi:hypothetical protein [Methylobacterium nigriterrae]|uniref:hypothetical protein n=1 Tax=Methylobacterium nigriterrae TaxID=3127512 RepID=UPI003013FE9B
MPASPQPTLAAPVLRLAAFYLLCLWMRARPAALSRALAVTEGLGADLVSADGASVRACTI